MKLLRTSQTYYKNNVEKKERRRKMDYSKTFFLIDFYHSNENEIVFSLFPHFSNDILSH